MDYILYFSPIIKCTHLKNWFHCFKFIVFTEIIFFCQRKYTGLVWYILNGTQTCWLLLHMLCVIISDGNAHSGHSSNYFSLLNQRPPTWDVHLTGSGRIPWIFYKLWYVLGLPAPWSKCEENFRHSFPKSIILVSRILGDGNTLWYGIEVCLTAI